MAESKAVAKQALKKLEDQLTCAFTALLILNLSGIYISVVEIIVKVAG